MGPSLSDLFYSVGKQFSLKTTLMLAEQMVRMSFRLFEVILKTQQIIMITIDFGWRIYAFGANSAKQINRLEFVHKKRIVHRDVKPGNFVSPFKPNKFMKLSA